MSPTGGTNGRPRLSVTDCHLGYSGLGAGSMGQNFSTGWLLTVVGLDIDRPAHKLDCVHLVCLFQVASSGRAGPPASQLANAHLGRRPTAPPARAGGPRQLTQVGGVPLTKARIVSRTWGGYNRHIGGTTGSPGTNPQSRGALPNGAFRPYLRRIASHPVGAGLLSLQATCRPE